MLSATSLDKRSLTGWEIRVRGTVQGVGFRPTVFQLATALGIVGHVLNDGDGVVIEAFGQECKLDQFIQAIYRKAPPLARINQIEHRQIDCRKVPADFSIAKSTASVAKTDIAADAATCAACKEEVFDRQNRRFRYPFTNCTHCGPRLSIIYSIPYDRKATSMSCFQMCSYCLSEYEDPLHRRFHAQPNACAVCGPSMWLEKAGGGKVDLFAFKQLDAIDAAASLIEKGAIVAIAGIGGFHLACEATNEDVVAKLRARKRRYHKPFALMASDIEMVKRYCRVNTQEENLLKHHAAPIVILEKHGALAPAVAGKQNTLGFMLAYTPLHHLLMQRLACPIVLTSGNCTNEPQAIDNDDARDRLSAIADYFLFHNREIVNRLDDSLVRVISGAPAVLRRARGYAPQSIPLPEGFAKAPQVLAMGAELKNTFCLIKEAKAIVSQHMGDLEDARTYEDYRKTLALYRQAFAHAPARLAVDLHPEYLSSKLGRQHADENNLPLDEVQHHHAHIASCLADNNWPLGKGPVLGVALDGLGYGDDGTFWGGEFLLCDYVSFERLASFKPVPMLGGTLAIKQPWRNTYAHLITQMNWQSLASNYEKLELTAFFKTKPVKVLNAMLANKVNSPMSTSCGRLFDAVAAAIGVCREEITYEGQAAIELEALIDQDALINDAVAYPFAISQSGGMANLDAGAFWQALLTDLVAHTDPGIISARFHRGLANAVAKMIEKLCHQNGGRSLNTVALSGGVFQNKVLLELLCDHLDQKGYKVLKHRQVPANDGGLSLGQAVISAARFLSTESIHKE